jgi:hypothetical protein
MAEFRKNAESVKGMPLLQFVSIGASGNSKPSQESNEPAQDEQARAEKQERQDDDSAVPTSTSQAVMKGLGGMFGRKKKKQQEQEQQQQAAQQSAPAAQQPAHAANPNALMEMTVEVTSVGNSPVDPSLFEIPAGYTQVQRSADEVIGGKK